MKKIIIIVFLGYLIGLYGGMAHAQNYNTLVGLRAGLFSGVSLRHFISPEKAVHGILSGRWRGLSFVGLIELQKPTTTENLSWFIGFGAHAGFFNRLYYYPNNSVGYYDGLVNTIGIDAIAGLEYRFKDLPVTIMIDVKPFFDAVNPGGGYFDTGLSVSYIIE